MTYEPILSGDESILISAICILCIFLKTEKVLMNIYNKMKFKLNKTLVLNADNQPINVTNVFRAFKLVDKGKAIIIVHDMNNPILASENREFKRPLVIRLLDWVNIPYKKSMPLTRHNIYKRDGNRCVYCGSYRKLTLDHVMPKSRGGKNTWQNLVTCCSKCNLRKDNKTPKEAGMEMSVKPYAPSYIDFIRNDRLWQGFMNRLI